jgi:hypothetical protein
MIVFKSCNYFEDRLKTTLLHHTELAVEVNMYRPSAIEKLSDIVFSAPYWLLGEVASHKPNIFQLVLMEFLSNAHRLSD